MPTRLERAFRAIALTEATSFLALLVATAIKYGADKPIGVEILGPIHGALFVAYVGLALVLWPRAAWKPLEAALVLLGAVVPFGGYVVDRWLLRRADTLRA